MKLAVPLQCRSVRTTVRFFLAGFAASLTLAAASAATAQPLPAADTIVVRSGSLSLRGLLWRPRGGGPFPAVLFNHGSYETSDSSMMLDPSLVGPVLARRGYVVFVLFRQGVGLSIGQDSSGGDRMAQAKLRGGQRARNVRQLELLEGPELAQAQAGVLYLKGRPDVDRERIGLLGHSFGGALSLLLAGRDTSIHAVVSFSGGAGSWQNSPELRARLAAAVADARAAIFFNHAANDYSTASGVALAAEMARLRRPHLLRIYPRFGQSARDGHNMVFRDPSIWESDVVAFLNQHLSRR